MGRSNYLWNTECTYMGIKKEEIAKLINFFNVTLIEMANILVILTLLYLILCGLILNFFVSWPFIKAYGYKDSSEVSKAQLYQQIREGSHQCLILSRNMLNLVMVCIQFFYLTFAIKYQNDQQKVLVHLKLMIEEECSGETMMMVLRQMLKSLTYMEENYWLITVIIMLTIYFDWFGLYFAQLQTWRRIGRGIKYVL